MSLWRMVYQGAVICGWMALLGWLPAEVLRSYRTEVAGWVGTATGQDAAGKFLAGEQGLEILAFGLVGATIGAGLGLAGGLSNPRPGAQILRMIRGLAAGGIGGFVGSWIGGLIYQAATRSGSAESWWLRPAGWVVAGSLIGLGDGLVAFSPRRMRNGLIGGLVGGLVGGLLFGLITAMARFQVNGREMTFEMTSRAIGFVLIGISIGGMIGLANVLLKHAWLTVLDGDRPGRQLILGGRLTTLGRSPDSGLVFSGKSDLSLELTHLKIIREGGGAFAVVPAVPAADALVDGVRLIGRQPLRDGQTIVLGRNAVRFNERANRGAVEVAPVPTPAPPIPKPSRPSWANPPTTGTGEPEPQPIRAEAAPRPQPAPVPISPPAPIPPPRPSPPPVQAPPPPAPRRPPANPYGAGPPGAPAPARPQPPAPSVRPPAPAPPPAILAPPPPPRPAPAPAAGHTCPNGHKLPPGQRFCILCGEDF